MHPGCPNVHWNTGRQCWYIDYKDEDGCKRRKFFTPKRSDHEELAAQYVSESATEAQLAWDAFKSQISDENVGDRGASSSS